MRTLIFDIDGTLTDMGPIEAISGRLSPAEFADYAQSGRLPLPARYPIIDFILANRANYNFVYATGGLKREADYALAKLGIFELFDIQRSLSIDTFPDFKSTGWPFLEIMKTYPHAMVITDSQSDVEGAIRAGLPYQVVRPNAQFKLNP